MRERLSSLKRGVNEKVQNEPDPARPCLRANLRRQPKRRRLRSAGALQSIIPLLSKNLFRRKTLMLHRRAVSIALISTLLCLPIFAQSQSDKELLERIRKEAMTNSQIMKTMHMLSDVYGPRLTGSPNHKASAEWAVKQMTAWGLSNGHLHAWDFKHPGWLNERLSAHIVAPVKDSLVAYVLAWTPGTRGVVRANPYHINHPARPSHQK